MNTYASQEKIPTVTNKNFEVERVVLNVQKILDTIKGDSSWQAFIDEVRSAFVDHPDYLESVCALFYIANIDTEKLEDEQLSTLGATIIPVLAQSAFHKETKINPTFVADTDSRNGLLYLSAREIYLHLDHLYTTIWLPTARSVVLSAQREDI